MGESEHKARVGVVLVHGIGVQQRDTTLDSRVRCLTAESPSNRLPAGRSWTATATAALGAMIVAWATHLNPADGLLLVGGGVAVAGVFVCLRKRTAGSAGFWKRDSSAPPQLQAPGDLSPLPATQLQLSTDPREPPGADGHLRMLLGSAYGRTYEYRGCGVVGVSLEELV